MLCLSRYAWYKNLDAMRKMVILDLSYNVGLNGLLQFKRFIKLWRVKIML